jgi:alkanesulfonate monooxygenase SsuD/methylene tetrahydromethanopterin reductase-like flavin-dependent oxidoreductase (luciferase family)
VRFSLDFAHQAWTRAVDPVVAARRTVDLARRADAAGVDLVTVSEDPDGWDAFALLGAIAVSTSRAALGTSVTSPYLRHPNLLAASVATLDRLSGGRAVLGLGRGQSEWYERGLGATIGSPLTALAETISLLRQWWQPPHQARSQPDDHFRIDGWERTVHPVQSRPPIYLAAAGPKAIALAGRVAGGVIFNNLTSDEALTARIHAARQAARAVGRDSGELTFLLRTQVVVTDDPSPWLERQKNALAIINTLPGMDRLVETAGFDVPAILADVRRVMRTDEALRDATGFAALRRHADFTAARRLIPSALIERLTIAGPLPQVRQRLQRLEHIGVTHVSLPPPDQFAALDEPEIAALLDNLRSGPE